MAAEKLLNDKQSKKHNDCLRYLQTLGDATPKEVVEQLACQINEEANKSDAASINQAALNMSFRVYYHIIHKYKLPDEYFKDLPQLLSVEQPKAFLMLQAVLLTDHWPQLDASLIEAKCIDAILDALQQNSNCLVHQLKATNLLVKKFPQLELLKLQLDHFYHCLQRQSQVGSREETLTLFNRCCRQRQRALGYFSTIMDHWSWTNRNKYYLLSGILNSHPLSQLLEESGHTELDFFAGLRLSLSYKGLRAASQYPIKSLSNQRSSALLQLAVELLVNGTVAELQNFHSQWFLRIQQRDALFQLLQAQPEIVKFLTNSEALGDPSDQHRLILIFSMFAKEIYVASKLHFFKISTELLTNCSTFEAEAQLLVFRFLVDNLGYFAVEDCLEFFYSFMERNRGIESSEFRNTMLGKMPNIINHTAKHFHKAIKCDSSEALSQDIKLFFSQLQQLIERDVKGDVYQPKIFALQLLQLLHRSLYSQQVAKNAKMCSLQQNQQLGAFLLAEGVFQATTMAQLLFGSLNDPQGFDDALELTVSLLLQLEHVDFSSCIEHCQRLCSSSDVDECSLVSLYAQLAVLSSKDQQLLQGFYAKSLRDLLEKSQTFQQDPLHTAKAAGGHLFGYICVLEQMVRGGGNQIKVPLLELLPVLEQILNVILKFLNLANARREKAAVCSAASFQDMDESLQLLVTESSHQESEDQEEVLRKYLLMSFWLTLKACCDLATSVGCSLLQDKDALQRCLDINVAVLTRCRHKGAIEAAGLSIGRLTRAMTRQDEGEGLQLLHDCLERELLSECRQVSTTRRGAGFSIMFLHVLKNDSPRRQLLHRAVQRILRRLSKTSASEAEASVVKGESSSSNHDRWESLALHYLCVLVKDTELRSAMCIYYNEIMLVAMAHIEHDEWTISNAALQLFGASLGKLVGQRQATEFSTRLAWEPSELNYEELACLLPKACEHMLQRCGRDQVTSSIILFLGFLSKVEHLCTSSEEKPATKLLLRFRQLTWRLLSDSCEQVRQLAATCFVRAHDFSCDLPLMLLDSVNLHLQNESKDENFHVGLLHMLHAGVLKMQHEARHVWNGRQLKLLQLELLQRLHVTEQVKRLNSYTLGVLLRLLELLQAEEQIALVRQLLEERKLTPPEVI